MTASLVLDAVACHRGGRMLFEGLSLSLTAGDALILRGPNGAGKSSLLRLVAGLLRPAAGAVTCEGRMALSDDALALDAEMPLARALQFWAAIDGGGIDAALDAVSLSPLAQVPVRMLSTGQRKRATLARVIASGAEIWLLDEPSNGLDAAAIDGLGRAMATHRAAGGIVLAASHLPMGLENAREIVIGGAA